MEISNGKTGVSQNQGWHLVRIAVAGLLLTASALKCWQLATEPIIGTSLLDSRWLLMATVEFELLFGLWLLANIWAKPTWAAALACFGLFTCVSVCKAISGHASCGCFGHVAVNPWYTGMLDLGVVVSLLRWRPKESFFTIRRATVVSVIWLAVGLPAALVMGRYADTTLSDIGEIIGDGKIIVLEPEKWVGKRFPLLSYIEDVPLQAKPTERPLRERLTSGHWIVALYRHDCPKCQQMIKSSTWETPVAGQSTRVALVEVPPLSFGGTGRHLDLFEDCCVFGQLSGEREWFVTTPLVAELDDGKVTEVAVEAGDAEPATFGDLFVEAQVRRNFK